MPESMNHWNKCKNSLEGQQNNCWYWDTLEQNVEVLYSRHIFNDSPRYLRSPFTGGNRVPVRDLIVLGRLALCRYPCDFKF